MENEERNLIVKKSMLVPSVQELAKAPLETIPPRYTRSNQDSPIILAAHDDYNLQVPIIDMKCLISGDEIELQRFHSACQEWGFFQLINHEVSPSLVEKLKQETREFFELPMEEKRKYWQTPSELEGFGQAFVVSEEQKLDWADMFYLNTLPLHQRKPHLFPMLPLPYRDTLESYSGEMRKLALKILDCMGKALDVETEVIRGVFGEGDHKNELLPSMPTT